MKVRFLLILLGLLVAAPVLPEPADDWTECSTSTSWLTATVDAKASSGGQICFEFDQSGADTSFRVLTSTATVCSVSNVNANGAGSLVWTLYSCPTGFTPSLAVCEDAVATFSTDDCTAVTKGRYFVDITTAVTDTEDAVISVRGY